MTKIVYVNRAAEDLRAGNMYVSWVHVDQEAKSVPVRILDVYKKRNGMMCVKLDDLSQLSLHPEHVIVIQEYT